MHERFINETDHRGKGKIVQKAQAPVRYLSTPRLVILSILISLSLASCATWEGKRHGGKAGRAKTPGEITRKGPVEKEVMRPAESQFAMVSTPARSASMDMVAKGKKQLAIDKYDKALGLFQEAVIIDSTNGVAYYFLAKTRFYLNQHEEAMGILDKAESLLAGTEEWMEAIALLRTQIQTSYLSGEEAKESDLIPIINRKE